MRSPSPLCEEGDRLKAGRRIAALAAARGSAVAAVAVLVLVSC
jgi:hypothetical protein